MQTYLPSETLSPLVKYREEEELKTLREDGTGERKKHERIKDLKINIEDKIFKLKYDKRKQKIKK